jgi:DNA-binding NarL/FixJ family response regulator
VRVLIADDHEMIRRGLRAMLAGEPEVDIVGEACNGVEAVRLAAELGADVVLMDLSMPGASGLAATREIVATRSPAQVVAMSANNDESLISSVLEAGAIGFLSKTCSFEQLLTAIRTAAPIS